MNKLDFTLLIGGCLLLQPQPAAAFDREENNGDTETISLFATAEPIKAGEAKSSVRVRATDKASFKAVENIPSSAIIVIPFRDMTLNQVPVYYIVDNFMEDLTVRTTEQTEDKLCVEVNGYSANSENILKAFNENFKENYTIPHADPANQDAAYPDKLELENDAAAGRVSGQRGPPPKPQVDIKDELKAENISDREKRNDDSFFGNGAGIGQHGTNSGKFGDRHIGLHR